MTLKIEHGGPDGKHLVLTNETGTITLSLADLTSMGHFVLAQAQETMPGLSPEAIVEVGMKGLRKGEKP